MRRFGLLFLIVGMLLILSGCEIVFYRTLEYNISGSASSIDVRYTNRSGDLVDSTVLAPWSTDFDLYSSNRPFLAFIEVDNNGLTDVAVNIVYDDGTVVSGTAVAGGPILELYEIIE